MKTKRSFIHVLICSFIICFAILGCEGPEGPTGPQGEQGQQGLQGDLGPTGPQGPAGEDGNANVIYSDWFFPDWNDIDEPSRKRMIVSHSDFSSARSNGVILFYWTTNNGSTFLLPWISFNTSGDVVIERFANVRGDSDEAWIEIRKFGADFNVTETNGQVRGTTYNRIRFVIIPGGLPAKMPSDFFENYSAVKTFYGLPD